MGKAADRYLAGMVNQMNQQLAAATHAYFTFGADSLSGEIVKEPFMEIDPDGETIVITLPDEEGFEVNLWAKGTEIDKAEFVTTGNGRMTTRVDRTMDGDAARLEQYGKLVNIRNQLEDLAHVKGSGRLSSSLADVHRQLRAYQDAQVKLGQQLLANREAAKELSAFTRAMTKASERAGRIAPSPITTRSVMKEIHDHSYSTGGGPVIISKDEAEYLYSQKAEMHAESERKAEEIVRPVSRMRRALRSLRDLGESHS